MIVFQVILSLKDQQKVFATAVELALTRASAPRLLTIIETLLKCTQSNTKTNKSLLFPLPRIHYNKHQFFFFFFDRVTHF